MNPHRYRFSVAQRSAAIAGPARRVVRPLPPAQGGGEASRSPGRPARASTPLPHAPEPDRIARPGRADARNVEPGALGVGWPYRRHRRNEQAGAARLQRLTERAS